MKWIGMVLFFCGCASEEGVKVYNSNPEATITSIVNGDSFIEGAEITLVGQVSDGNHEFSSLQVTWESGEGSLCAEDAANIDGSSSCTVVLGVSDTSIRLNVVDPEGAAGTDQVSIEISPNNAPTATILSPLPDSQHYSDSLILFSAQIGDIEDDVEMLSYAWNSSIDGLLPSSSEVDSNGVVEQFFLLSEGQHAISFDVEDSAGKTTSDTIAILVGGVNITPTCSITSPQSQSGFIIGQTITFSGTAFDDDINNSLLDVSWTSDQDGMFNSSIADSSGDIEFFFDGLSAGNHSIMLRVEDEVGAFCTESILLSIGSAPSLTLTNPTHGDVYMLSESIVFSGTVSDSEDIPSDISISWTSDIEGVFSTQGSDSNGNISFTISSLTAGEHNLVVTATDTAGLTTNAVRSVRVNTPPLAPVVSITPSTPLGNDTLTTTLVESPDPDGDALSFSYEWFQNGVLTVHNTSSISPNYISAGDTWIVQVTPNDGHHDGDYGEASVTVLSSAPEFDVATSITPSVGVYTATTLSCSASATDVEDGILTPIFSWEIGGVVVATGAIYTIDATQSDVGDDVFCIATATDSDQEVVTSTAQVSIENTPPTQPSISITPTSPQASQDDLVCSIDVVSTDIDQQAISYTYTWEQNGNTTSDTTDTIPASDVVMGDTWVCYVIPNDGLEDGLAGQSTSILVSSVCPSSNAVIATPSDVVTYELCTELDSISISTTSGISDVTLPNLVTVHDSIYVSNNSDLQNISFPLLESVGGYVYFYHNYEIETLALDSLETVDEYLYFDTNIALFALTLDSLTYVGSYTYFSNNEELCVPELNWSSIAQSYHYDNGNRDCSTQTFSYTGGVQTFIVPNVSVIEVVLYGAEGGDGWNNDVSGTLGYGGEGAVVSATIPVTPGENLSLYVGGAGEDATSNTWGVGGYNGGGDGSVMWDYYGGGGGGATDIRRGSALSDRIVIAGGAGAGSGWCTDGTGNGGDAGGLQGQSGQMCSNIAVGTGGTQSLGGNIGGALGIGGSASTNGGAGGGGGYYGGGASEGSGGGGGSSFIDTSASGTMTGGAHIGDGVIVISW